MKPITEIVLNKLNVVDIIAVTAIGYIHPLYWPSAKQTSSIDVDLIENGPEKQICIGGVPFVTLIRPGALKASKNIPYNDRKMIAQKLGKKLKINTPKEAVTDVNINVFFKGTSIKAIYHFTNTGKIDDACAIAYLKDGEVLKTFGSEGPTTQQLEERIISAIEEADKRQNSKLEHLPFDQKEEIIKNVEAIDMYTRTGDPSYLPEKYLEQPITEPMEGQLIVDETKSLIKDILSPNSKLLDVLGLNNDPMLRSSLDELKSTLDPKPTDIFVDDDIIHTYQFGNNEMPKLTEPLIIPSELGIITDPIDTVAIKEIDKLTNNTNDSMLTKLEEYNEIVKEKEKEKE